MGIKERRDREKQELRSKILDVAREMFAQDGFAAVTMRELAKRIEYSPASIYLHFKDKEALIAELCASDLAVIDAQLDALAATTGDAVERVRASSLAFVKFALAHPAQYQVLFMMQKPTPNGEAALVDPYRGAYEKMRVVFDELVQDGRLKARFSDADLAAQTYFCGLHGVIAFAIGSHQCLPAAWKPPLAQTEFLVETLLTGLLK